jgi:hypothetical protein
MSTIVSKDCYQVKVNVEADETLITLYKTLGDALFTVVATCPPVVDGIEFLPQVVDVAIDPCNPHVICFTVYVELPVTDDDPAVVYPLEHAIMTQGHSNPLTLLTFTVYPLPLLPEEVASRGRFDSECDYEIARVPCYEEDAQSTPVPIPDPTCFRLVFPMTEDIACLVPNFGVSGFYLNNKISSSLRMKVRLVPQNVPLSPGQGGIAVGLLSYDPETCTACLEVCDDEELFGVLTAGYEALFNYVSGAPPAVDTIAELAQKKTFILKGVDKCSENPLFVFNVCTNAPILTPISQGTNYKIRASGVDYCYEFYTPAVEEETTTTVAPTTTSAPTTTVTPTTTLGN